MSRMTPAIILKTASDCRKGQFVRAMVKDI